MEIDQQGQGRCTKWLGHGKFQHDQPTSLDLYEYLAHYQSSYRPLSQTETTVGGLGMHADFKIGTCGKPLPGIEVSILPFTIKRDAE